jgi:hypothetical protein
MQYVVANALQASIAVNTATALMFILALCETWWQAQSRPSLAIDGGS